MEGGGACCRGSVCSGDVPGLGEVPGLGGPAPGEWVPALGVPAPGGVSTPGGMGWWYPSMH